MTERTERGQFAAGNPGGPGRPKRPTEKAYLDRLTTKLTLAKWDSIVDKAISLAMTGDYRARQWISEYVIGKPAVAIELTSPDQALLADLLRQCDSRGLSASALFESMLAVIAEQQTVEGDDNEL